MDKAKLTKTLLLLALLTIFVGAACRVVQRNSMTLTEYESLQGGKQSASNTTDSSDTDTSSDTAASPSNKPVSGESISGTSASRESASGESISGTSTSNKPASGESVPKASGTNESQNSGMTENLQDTETTLTGALLNGDSQKDYRTTYQKGFYYEPVSDSLQRYMTGVSYPAVSDDAGKSALVITFEELSYVHILHYDFDGNLAEGELICNQGIAQDLVEIFYELYLNEYQLESVLLIDTFDGDDIASMEADNTSCFNYRVVAGSSSISRHAYGLAIDINPLYNPYVKYEKDGTGTISPDTAASYADRSANFPYKIDENDLCYKLFIQHGFTWGGNWNNVKDYQHFQKAL